MTENKDPQVNISVEQILAAVLHTTGPLELNQQSLVEDYSQFAIAVDPNENGKLEIALVNLNDLEPEEPE